MKDQYIFKTVKNCLNFFVFVYLVEQEFDDRLVRIRLGIMQGSVTISVFPKKILKLFFASQCFTNIFYSWKGWL